MNGQAVVSYRTAGEVVYRCRCCYSALKVLLDAAGQKTRARRWQGGVGGEALAGDAAGHIAEFEDVHSRCMPAAGAVEAAW